MTVTTHRWMEYENGMGVVKIRSRPASESVRESSAFIKAAKEREWGIRQIAGANAYWSWPGQSPFLIARLRYRNSADGVSI